MYIPHSTFCLMATPSSQSSIHRLVSIPWFAGTLRHMESNGTWAILVHQHQNLNVASATTKSLPTWTRENSTRNQLDWAQLQRSSQWNKQYPRAGKNHGVEPKLWRIPSANLICWSTVQIDLHGILSVCFHVCTSISIKSKNAIVGHWGFIHLALLTRSNAFSLA